MDNEESESLSECIEMLENEASKVLSILHDEWVILTEDYNSDYIETTFNQMLENEETDADKLLIEGSNFDRNNKDELFFYLYLLPIVTACAYTAQAVKKAKLAKEKTDELKLAYAWVFISKAKWWVGMMGGRRAFIEVTQARKQARTKKAADVRHAENRALKKMGIDFYEEKLMTFKSKDAGAEAITNQVPVVFRTARKWIDDFHQTKKNKLPSPSRE